MSHQAARALLRTEPEQQASVAARFQKHQAATRSQILPPAALPDIENAHKCRILILQMPRTMSFKEVRDILRPFCTTNCIWDMCWLDSTRLQIIIDDHEVMRLRGSAFQLEDPTSSEEHWCDMDDPTQNLIWMDPMSRYTLSTTHPTPAAQLTPDCPFPDFSGLSVLPDTSLNLPSLPTIPEKFENFHFFMILTHPVVSDDSESMVPLGGSFNISCENFDAVFDHSWTRVKIGKFSHPAQNPVSPHPPHPASGPGKRGIALGFLAVLPAREIEGVPGTLILAKVPGLTEQQRKVSSWGFGLHVVSFSGSKATFRGRTATARWSSIDHFVCNQAARALLTSPRVNRQPYISDHWPIYASLLAVPPTPPDVFIPTFNPDRCKELAPTISLCNQFSILANLPDDCDSDTVTNRLLDIINPNTAFSSLSNLPLIDTPVPVNTVGCIEQPPRRLSAEAKNAYRAWLASRDSILSPQETIQGKYNQYILAEATASRLTKQDDRLRWRSHCTRIDNLLAGGCAKQAWNAAKRMACASGHSCRSSNPIRNEEGVLQFQPISICNTPQIPLYAAG
ncbi:hypothetical protein BASA83_009332 [Batrachochytrium salamandrivorans]|nr:hypothetical protein BASA83_009332 [Batrachochytrium salamandrivorans]